MEGFSPISPVVHSILLRTQYLHSPFNSKFGTIRQCSTVPLAPSCAKHQLTSTHVTPAFRIHCLLLHRFRPPWIFLLPAMFHGALPALSLFCFTVNSINRLAFVMESRCVYLEVWTAGAFVTGLAVRLRKGPWNRYFGLPPLSIIPLIHSNKPTNQMHQSLRFLARRSNTA